MATVYRSRIDETHVGLTSPLFSSVPLVGLWAFLSLAAGFRWFGDGMDFVHYYEFYNSIPTHFFLGDSRFEPGYQLVAWLFRSVFNLDYGYFATFLVAVALGVKFWLFQRHLRWPLLAALVYVALFYPLHEYTQVRTAVGTSLGYLAIYLWHSRRIRWGLAAIAAATLFHYSIAALPVAYFGARLFRQPIIAAGSFLVLIAVVSAANQLELDLFTSVFQTLNPMVETYAFGSEFYFEQNILSVLNIGIVGLCVYATVFGKASELDLDFRFLFLLMTGLLCVVMFIDAPVLSNRLRDIFFVASVFLAFNRPVMPRDLPPILLLAGVAGYQLWSATQGGLISLG